MSIYFMQHRPKKTKTGKWIFSSPWFYESKKEALTDLTNRQNVGTNPSARFYDYRLMTPTDLKDVTR